MGNLSLLQGIFPTQGLNLGLLHCRQILYCLIQSCLCPLPHLCGQDQSKPEHLKDTCNLSYFSGSDSCHHNPFSTQQLVIFIKKKKQNNQRGTSMHKPSEFFQCTRNTAHEALVPPTPCHLPQYAPPPVHRGSS